MLCTFFVYVHFSSAFNFVNGDPIRKIQSFLLVSLRNLHSVKNVPNISSRQKTILQTRLNHKLESNFDKKKISRKDHRSFNIISKKYSSKNISRSEKFAFSSRVTSILPSHTCPANWTTLVSPRETKNSLESKNSWTKRSKQFRSHEKESHLPQAKISSFLLTRSNLRFRSIFSSFFFFSSFPCSCCVSQRRSFHISRVPTRHGQLFELSTTLKARAKHTRGGRGSIFEPLLRRRCFSFASPGGTPRMGMLETEIENSSDARQGNPWNSSVWLCLEYFCSKDVNLDLIFRLSKNS